MDYIEEKIIEEILNSGKVKPGDSIDYTQFLELYAAYKNIMREKEFAEILEISYGNYQTMKHSRDKSKNIKEYDKKTRKKRKKHKKRKKRRDKKTSRKNSRRAIK